MDMTEAADAHMNLLISSVMVDSCLCAFLLAPPYIPSAVEFFPVSTTLADHMGDNCKVNISHLKLWSCTESLL